MTEARFRNRIVGEAELDPRALVANPANWRTHPRDQAQALEATLDAVGWVQRVIVNQRTGHMVDGHLRAALAVQQGEPTVPVLYVDLAPDEEALVLASLDPLAAMAERDKDALAALLAGISAESDPIRALLTSVAVQTRVPYGPPAVEDPGPQLDRAAELQAQWGTERGQLWTIPSASVAGRAHRLLCGDATSAADVEAVLDRAIPHLCVTDPPYGVDYDPNWRNIAAAEGKLAYAARRVGPVANDDRADWCAAWHLFPGDVIYSWHPAGATSLDHAHALQAAGFILRMQIIWAKSNFPIGRGDYHVRHEPCWYAVRKGRHALRTADRTQTTLWEINLDANVAGGHSTQKPLECMARPIRNHETTDVYDPFLGSGTTFVAAEQLGRLGYGLEIAPEYVAVTLERLAGMGLEPRLL